MRLAPIKSSETHKPIPTQQKKPNKCCSLSRPVVYTTIGTACMVFSYTSAWIGSWSKERSILPISHTYAIFTTGAFLFGAGVGMWLERQRSNFN